MSIVILFTTYPLTLCTFGNGMSYKKLNTINMRSFSLYSPPYNGPYPIYWLTVIPSSILFSSSIFDNQLAANSPLNRCFSPNLCLASSRSWMTCLSTSCVWYRILSWTIAFTLLWSLMLSYASNLLSENVQVGIGSFDLFHATRWNALRVLEREWDWDICKDCKRTVNSAWDFEPWSCWSHHKGMTLVIFSVTLAFPRFLSYTEKCLYSATWCWRKHETWKPRFRLRQNSSMVWWYWLERD